MKVKLSKVLALIMACAIIFAALPLMAFAETETVNIYTVSNESPAIPMTAGTKIAVADLAVTFSDGTVVAGDALTWTSSDTSVVIKDGYIIAKEAGPVKLTVTAEGKTRNVYAAVATKEDAAKGVYKFYTYDFANGMGDEWQVDVAYQGTTTKIAVEPNENGDYVLTDKTPSTNIQYSKTKIDATTGQFVLVSYDTTTLHPNGIWYPYTYFLGAKLANDMLSAKDAGIISSTLYNKTVELGAYIPFANTQENYPITYYKQDGTTVSDGRMTQSTTYMYTKNEIFDDFTNYTAGAKMLNVDFGADWDSKNIGILGRVTYGSLHIHEYMGLTANSHPTSTKNSVTYMRASATDTSVLRLRGFYGQDPTTISGVSFDAIKNKNSYLNDSSEFYLMTSKFHNATITMSVGEQSVIFDGKLSDTTSRNLDVRAGSIGIAGNFTSVAVKEMYAAINSEYLVNIPEAIEVYYTVSYGAPAIPMNVNTAVDLDFINVEMDKAGTVVSGEDIVWDAAKQDGLYLNKKGNKVSVYKAGNYKLTATANGVTKNVWIVAKTADATDFNIVDYDFTVQAYDPDDWQLIYYSVAGGSVGTPIATDGTQPAYFENNSGKTDGYISFTPNNGTLDENGTKINIKHGILVNTSEIFKDFRDYTVVTDSIQKSDTNIQFTGIGTAARIALAADGSLDPNQNSFLSHVMSDKTLRAQSHRNTDWWLGAVNTEGTAVTTGAADFIRRDNKYHIVKTVYSGDTFVTTFDKDVVFDLNNAESKYKTTWAKETNYAVDAGYPGIFVWNCDAWVRGFEVKLNTTDMPDALAPEAAPEAEIVIKGEGTAEVEAVVGSDNTYTVEIAPATGYKVKVGSLYINGERVLGSDPTGRLYTFTAEDLNKTTIAVEYIEDNGQFNTAMLGATVWPEKKGIRFGARTDSIMRSLENENAGLLNDTIFVNGQNYDIVEIGMIMMPTQLFEGDLKIDTTNAIIAPVSKIVNLTDDFSDIAISLINIPESFNDIEIASVMYIAYNVDGETQYLYTEQIERTYNQVLADASTSK